MRARAVAIAIAIVVVALIALARATSILVDWLWFSSLGYREVFWTIIEARSALFVSALVVAVAALWASGTLALHFAMRLSAPPAAFPRRPGPWASPTPLPAVAPRLPWRIIIAVGALVLGVFSALGAMPSWDTALLFLNQVRFGSSDPVFGRDIGFYFFTLPALVALKTWLMALVLLAAIMAAAVYWGHGDIILDNRPPRLSRAALAHGSALLALYFLLKAGSYLLDRWLLLYSDNGVVIGAGYTDLHVRLPVLWLMAAAALACAIASGLNVRWRSLKVAIGAPVFLFLSSIIVAGIYPALFQRFYVKPSELALEAPYIARNIALTREAYGLGRITVKPFPVEQGLDFAALQKNRPTVDNIRLWDWQPLMSTYAQLQEIRTYYKFLDMDIDRYRLGGTYQQVMLSARELEPELLPANAQTWVNLHLLFTHGNGVVMSPVTRKTTEGLPEFLLQDIPPVSHGGPKVDEPRIYFGQGEDGYVIVKGGTPEFDYPKGKDNVYRSYDGKDGVPVAGALRRLLFSWHFGDPNILLTGYITPQSRILLHRSIQDRIRTIAPVLKLDHDPYLVVSEGRLYWMQDAYTTSAWFPYAQPQTPGGLDYIRNSIKVVVDAYNGTVDFYLSDPQDPLIRTWARVFPGLFKPLSAMPADLARHIRYPEDLFFAQAQLYRAYHMDSPEVFYNREDLWQFPRLPTGPSGSGLREGLPPGIVLPRGAGLAGGGFGDVPRMTPYYMIMRLPGEPEAEYIQMLPMAPAKRENMIAWLAARCDPPHYGQILAYEFPKEKLVYGPFQIEARIQQNTTISQQISLWNQMGSRVIRGNLLVVPIEQSILYVSPLYLRAETGQLPELKRVIAAYGDRVVMEETLGAALAALFKETAPPAALLPPAAASATGEKASVGPPNGPVDARAREALAHYNNALEKLKAGDWAGFGNELDAMRPLLEQLGKTPARQ